MLGRLRPAGLIAGGGRGAEGGATTGGRAAAVVVHGRTGRGRSSLPVVPAECVGPPCGQPTCASAGTVCRTASALPLRHRGSPLIFQFGALRGHSQIAEEPPGAGGFRAAHSGVYRYGVPQLARASVAAFSISPMTPVLASSLLDFPKVGGAVAVKPGVSVLTKTPAQLFDPGGASACVGPTASTHVEQTARTISTALRSTGSLPSRRAPTRLGAVTCLRLGITQRGVPGGNLLVEDSQASLCGGGLTALPGLSEGHDERACPSPAAGVTPVGRSR